ncbi:type I polyketide synthase, partial [Streptomyces sp. NPDC003719]
MSCRLPQARGLDAYWQLLRSGTNAVTETPSTRWDAEALHDSEFTTPGKVTTRFGGYLDDADVRGFDAAFFGISPREAQAMDPQQRMLLELAWEALENARVVPASLDATATGVFVGSMWDDYTTLLRDSGLEAITRHSLIGTQRSVLANRISYHLGLTGPSLTVDSGQSSSLVAVYLAVESLRRGESSLAIAAGITLNLVPESTVTAGKLGGLSPDGRCYTFDSRANGYIRGEGCGVIVLKPLAQALADGDPIHCVIRGSAVNNDGGGASIATPRADAQERVIRLACADAQVPTDQVQYVELHGTGTPVGDPVEAAALGATLGSERDGDDPLYVGSVKTNIGHLESAAGIAGLIKTALSIKHRTLPPSLNYESPNPNIPLDELRLRVRTETGAWPHPERSLIAGVSSWGMGGTNAHVILEQAPAEEPAGEAERGGSGLPVVWPVSAKTPGALREQAERLAAYVRRAGDAVNVAGVAHTLVHGRTRFEERAAVVGESAGELLAGLEALAADRPHPALVTASTTTGGKTVFVFPGQGSQWAGMGADLYHHSPVFAEHVTACARALAPHTDFDLIDVILHKEDAPGLERVDVIQPVLWAMMVSLARLWQHHGIQP